MQHLNKSKNDMALPPFVALIVSKLLDYVGEHSTEIVSAIKKEFHLTEADTGLHNALQELGYAPTEENLGKVHDLLVEKNKDPGKLANVLINNTTILPDTL